MNILVRMVAISFLVSCACTPTNPGGGSANANDEPVLKAGIYSGSLRCNLTDLFGNQIETTEPMSFVVGDAGLPRIDGNDVTVGLETTADVAGLSGVQTVTQVQQASNGVIVELDVALMTELCAETCQHSNDGECDDGGTSSTNAECSLGTDCADCGSRPLAMEGTGSATYTAYGVDRIDYRSSSLFNATGFGLVRQECQGILAP